MEFEAKKLLMERLDKSLLDHASALSSDSGGPTILGVYTLQGLAEMHCYLKTAHEFNAAEVDGLLQFADPLEVAQDCWENNPHEYSFPICELLEATHAHERFPLAEPAPPPERRLCGSVCAPPSKKPTVRRQATTMTAAVRPADRSSAPHGRR